MVKMFKNIALLLLLAAFLLPASGVLVFIHQCQSMGTTTHSLNGSNTCCKEPAGLFRVTDPNTTSCIIAGSYSQRTGISKEACCKDSRLFVKIADNYLFTASQIFQANIFSYELPEFSGLRPVVYTAILRGITSDTPDPPGNNTYLFISSLRL